MNHNHCLPKYLFCVFPFPSVLALNLPDLGMSAISWVYKYKTSTMTISRPLRRIKCSAGQRFVHNETEPFVSLDSNGVASGKMQLTRDHEQGFRELPLHGTIEENRWIKTLLPRYNLISIYPSSLSIYPSIIHPSIHWYIHPSCSHYVNPKFGGDASMSHDLYWRRMRRRRRKECSHKEPKRYREMLSTQN